jgi:nitronate monooxygenase
LNICVEHKVPIVITSLGAVKELVDTVHSYGGLVFHDVTTRRHAEKAAEAGVDGSDCRRGWSRWSRRHLEPVLH